MMRVDYYKVSPGGVKALPALERVGVHVLPHGRTGLRFGVKR